MPYITDVSSNIIYSLNNELSLEVSITTESGINGKSSVVSINKEYQELLKIVDIINKNIAPNLIGYDVREQLVIDNLLLKKEFSDIDLNYIYAISQTLALTASNYNKQQLFEYLGGFNAHIIPTPMINLSTDDMINKIYIVPFDFKTYKEALKCGLDIKQKYQELLKNNKKELDSLESYLDIVMSSITNMGYKPGVNIGISINFKAYSYYNQNTKQYMLKQPIKVDELINYYEQLIKKYPISSIEDPLSDLDKENWTKLTKRIGNKIQIIGNKFFTKDIERLEYSIKHNSVNAIAFNPSTFGTITQTFNIIENAKRAGYSIIVSSNELETEDSILADLAVSLSSNSIKCHSITNYNQLIRIEDCLNGVSEFNNKKFLNK